MIMVVLLIVGLCLGSFVNALVWRLHEQEKNNVKHKQQNKKQLSKAELSILQGRSMCPDCFHKLAAKDLVPLISWLILRGKCRYCHKPISWQYPTVELLTTGLFIFSYKFWPVPLHGFGLFEFVLWLVFLIGFMALAVFDLRWYTLPTKVIRPLIALAIVQVGALSLFYNGGIRTVASALIGALVIGGLFYMLFLVSHGAWIGGGDVRLGILLGLLVGGPLMSFFLIFIASLFGTLVALPLLGAHRLKRTSRMPFGPFLLVGAILTQLFGAAIIHWYKNRILGV